MKKVLFSLMIAVSFMGAGSGLVLADGATTYCCSCPPPWC